MGACLKKHVNTLKVIQQIENGEFSEVIKEIDYQDVNPVGKDPTGRTPFGVACRKGQAMVVKHFLEGNHKDRITEKYRSKGLFLNCKGEASGDVVQLLLDDNYGVVADIHYFDPDTISTALHECVRKRTNMNPKQLAERAMVVGMLTKAGANL
jgi:hypothetical protein